MCAKLRNGTGSLDVLSHRPLVPALMSSFRSQKSILKGAISSHPPLYLETDRNRRRVNNSMWPLSLLLISVQVFPPSRSDFPDESCVKIQTDASTFRNQIEQRAVIRFFTLRGLKSKDIQPNFRQCRARKRSLYRP
jgi:hypothetical protein